jgi:tripartite-type tricarboxylate transporter receptor subunit TctC
MRKLRFLLPVLLCAVGGLAQGQDYPNHPVRIVVPFPPGGPTDIIGRHIAKRLGEELPQQFIVENKGGANGIIGTDLVARSKPDGYTIVLTASGPLASGLPLNKSVPYDVVRDFAPVSLVATSSIVLVASPQFPARTFQEFLTLAKAKPEAVSAELNTIGSIHHLLTELLRTRTGAKFLLVPYKGSAPAITDLMAGHVQVGFESVPGVLEYIKAGKLKALAVATDKRLEALPDVPTFKELGMPELVAEPWWAIAAPTGTPKEAIDKLSAALAKIAKMPEVKEQFAAQGMVPAWTSPADTAAFIKAEAARWMQVVRETGATGQ